MENNSQNIEQEQDQNQIENQENYENGENGEQAAEGLGLNYEGEYEGEMEGEEEHIERDQEGEEGQEEEMEEGQEEQVYEGEEEAMEEGQEEAQENDGEENYVEQIEEVKIDNEKENENNINNKNEEIKNDNNENDIKEKEISEDNNKYQNSNNKNLSNEKNLSNKKRIELLQNKLNLKDNKAQTIKNNKNENIIDKDVEEYNDNDNSKNDNYRTFNINKKDDVLSELLGKIQDFKQKKQDINFKLHANNNLEELDKELIKGLEKLNNTNFNNNKMINNLNEEKKVNRPSIERKILRNPKFKEIISLINEKDIKRSKYYNKIGKNDLSNIMNYKNKSHFSDINFYAPKRNKYISHGLENKSFGNNFKRNDNNKYYISCIDGKAIVNGIRKDIPFASKFNINRDKLLNNHFLFSDLYQVSNVGKSSRRNNSFNINKYMKNKEFNYDGNKTQKFNYEVKNFNFEKLKNDFSKENLTNQLNKINDNYYKRELKFFK